MSYQSTNPYLVDVVRACRHFGLTEFDENAEFWTLGHHWAEYRQLVDLGLRFSSGGYNNVDRGYLPPSPPGCVAHPFTEFTTIHKLWGRPVCLNFDSTIGIVRANTPIIASLARLVVRALDVSERVLLNLSFCVNYAGSGWSDDPGGVLEEWAACLEDHWGGIEFLDSEGSSFVTKITQRVDSPTPMLSFHVLFSR